MGAESKFFLSLAWCPFQVWRRHPTPLGGASPAHLVRILKRGQHECGQPTRVRGEGSWVGAGRGARR